MKTALRIVLTIAMASLLASCKESQTERKPAMTGAPYELIVSVDTKEWDGALGDTLRSIFLEPVEFLNQTEPRFELMRIKPDGFDNFIAKHRNVLMIRINPDVAEPRSVAQYDYNAQGQIVVVLTAPSDSTMTAYLDDNRKELITLFESTERDRIMAVNKRANDKPLIAQIEKLFGLHIDVPQGYISRGTSQGDYMVISSENRTLTQGIAIYSYPYVGRNDFSLDSLIAERNHFDSRFPGPSEGSYMATSTAAEPDLDFIKINGTVWARMRGFWEMENDYMGGPFVSYSALDTLTNRIVTLDCFVYSPKKPKRNAIRSLEAVVESARFIEPATDTLPDPEQ